MKVILMGRHTPEGVDFLDIEDTNFLDIVGGVPRPIMFPATSEACRVKVLALAAEAERLNCFILFQTVPAQLGIAIGFLVGNGEIESGMIGVLISEPTTRLARATRGFESNRRWMPKTGFRFSHIEWFGEASTK